MFELDFEGGWTWVDDEHLTERSEKKAEEILAEYLGLDSKHGDKYLTMAEQIELLNEMGPF